MGSVPARREQVLSQNNTGRLRDDNCLVVVLRFLLPFYFGKNRGFLVRIGRSSGARADRSSIE
jgi:hypothetical protein